jgi:competence protein ComFC
MRSGASIGILLPGRCASCAAWGSAPLCTTCASGIRWLGNTREVNHALAFDRARAACAYEGPAREALKAFKLLGERRTARWLAERMVPVARALSGNIVTWVPATRASESARGFNPSEEIARPLARFLRLPARRLLVKSRDTLDSAGLSREQRRVNLLDAFAAKGTVAGHVLLVDDIFTTGATAGECAAVLKGAGAREVSVVTFARTP